VISRADSAPGLGAGQFSFTAPFGIATDSAHIWVSDPGNNRPDAEVELRAVR